MPASGASRLVRWHSSARRPVSGEGDPGQVGHPLDLVVLGRPRRPAPGAGRRRPRRGRVRPATGSRRARPGPAGGGRRRGHRARPTCSWGPRASQTLAASRARSTCIWLTRAAESNSSRPGGDGCALERDLGRAAVQGPLHRQADGDAGVVHLHRDVGRAPGTSRTARALASMLRRRSNTRRFSSQTWSSRKRRSCSERSLTVAWVRSQASIQSKWMWASRSSTSPISSISRRRSSSSVSSAWRGWDRRKS